MALTPVMVTMDCADARSLARFWTEAAGYTFAQEHGDLILLRPVSGAGVWLGLQQVPEPRQGKNRVHLDWRSDDRGAEVERLVSLGATVVSEQSEPGLSWTVLADPELNEFCVVG